MPIFKFLHILAMVLAVGIAVGSDFLLYRIAMTHEVQAIRAAFQAAWRYSTLAQLFFIVGMIFGLMAAFFSQFNFFAPWLLIAYALLAAILVIRGSITLPWQQRVLHAASADENQGLVELLNAKNVRTVQWAYLAMLVVIIYAMVMKPGGIQ